MQRSGIYLHSPHKMVRQLPLHPLSTFSYAGFVTWVGINENQFSLEKGKGVLTCVSSSKKSKYGFCSKCGSSILFKSTKWDGEIHITLANLHFSFGIKPQDPTKITMHRLSVELPINFPKFGVSI